MPYIKKEMRTNLKFELDNLLRVVSKYSDDEIEGVLNYCFTELLSSLQRDGHGGWKYRYLNRAVGVLECCKLELYRRACAPYEDLCIKNNGDVEIYKE